MHAAGWVGVPARVPRTSQMAVTVARMCRGGGAGGEEVGGEQKVKPQEGGVGRKASAVSLWVSSLGSRHLKGPSLGTLWL